MNSAVTPATAQPVIEAPRSVGSPYLFKRILVATDFSAQATQATKMALQVGHAFQSEIHVAHAVTPVVVAGEGLLIPPDVLSSDLEAAKVSMDRFMSAQPDVGDLKVRKTVALGDPVDLVMRLIEEEKIDLIVAGSHGATGLERLVLGSVAETILRRTQIPVLVVGPHCEVSRHPFGSIVLASDLTTTGVRPALYACALAERGHGRLTLLHVMDKKARVPGYEADLFQDRLKKQMEGLLPAQTGMFCKPIVRVEHGNPAEVILSVAHVEAATMIVVGLRPRSLLAEHSPWSTLSHVIRDARCGLLAVRDQIA